MAAGMARVEEARRANNAPELAAHALFLLGLSAQHLDQGARGRARAPASAVTSWRNGWTATPRPIPIWAARAPTGSARRRSRSASTSSRTSARAPTTIPASWRSAPRVAARANITYKILFNDAVAMTGGQHNEGDLDPARIAHEVRPWASRTSRWSTTRRKRSTGPATPRDLERHERDELMTVQERFQEIEGVSAIIYVQTCAAEKRRRRKRGTFPDPDRASSSTPMSARAAAIAGCSRTASPSCRSETELGRKRAIDQSTCNKDFSCLKGFCPVLRDGRGRHAARRPRRRSTSRACRSPPPEDRRHPQHRHHRRRRHRRRDHRRGHGAWPPISTARAPA
jgi:indolepyruvate ferredoxin oxidoreductase